MKDIFIGEMTVHFGHRKYSQWDSKSAPKNSQSFIISIGQTIFKEDIIEIILEQIIPPEKDLQRTYYCFQYTNPWILNAFYTERQDNQYVIYKGDSVFQKRSQLYFSLFRSLSFLSQWDIPLGVHWFGLYGISHLQVSSYPIQMKRQYPIRKVKWDTSMGQLFWSEHSFSSRE